MGIHEAAEPKALSGDQRPFGARRYWVGTKKELGEAGAEKVRWRVQEFRVGGRTKVIEGPTFAFAGKA